MVMEKLEQFDWLAQTKFLYPHLNSDIVQRPRLVAALHEAVRARRLTLISAPAGSGKTTLLASLPKNYPALRLAWFAVDEEDNDPVYFLSALTAALRTLNPNYQFQLHNLLAGLPDPMTKLRTVVSVLINDIIQMLPDDFVLVLDDLHYVTQPAVYTLLEYLLERAPSQMHLVIASRYDPPMPMGRLRARGQVAELRLEDLRFTQSEIATFVNERLGLALSPAELAILQNRSEGWAAGLRMLASSFERLPGSSERSAFIGEWLQTDRYLFHYLGEEVLNRQSLEVRTFLLETSILNELNPTVCEAVTGRDNAAAILEDLHSRNLFIIVVDERSQTYRYHDLFAGFLRAKLQQEMPEWVPILHKCAAHAQTLPGKAIHHYLAAEMWEDAAQTIEQVVAQVVQQGLFNTLQGWVEALPAPTLAQHPWLDYYLGFYAFQRGQLLEARTRLERAQQGFIVLNDQAGQDETLVQLINCTTGLKDFDGAARLIQIGLSRPLNTHNLVQLLACKIWLEMVQRNWEQASADLATTIGAALESNRVETFNLMALLIRAPLALVPGGVDLLESYNVKILERYGEQIPLLAGGTYSMLACLCLWRGNLNEVEAMIEKARHFDRQLGGVAMFEAELDSSTALYNLMRGNYSLVEEYLKERLPQVEQNPQIDHWYVMLLYLLGRCYWLQGKLEQAAEVGERLVAFEHPLEVPGAEVVRAVQQAMLLISQQDYAAAERKLLPMLELEQQVRISTLFASARLLLAQLYLQRNRSEEALALLEPMLAEAQRQRTPGTILKEGPALLPLLRLALEKKLYPEFVEQLISTLGEAEPLSPVTMSVPRIQPETQSVRIPDTGETLSAREIEVLRLLAVRATNREIAEQLIISELTVKSHVKNILRKLDLNSRQEVAGRARELGLISA